MKPVKILFKEYEMLREEVLESFRTRNQILSYGLATIVFIVGGAAAILNNTNQTYHSAGILLLFVVLPGFVVVLAFSFLNEIEKVQVIGNHLLNTENEINRLVAKDLLKWEKNLRKDPLPYYSYVAIFSLFTAIDLLPVCTIYAVDEFKWWYGIVSVTIITLFYFFSISKIIKRIKMTYKIVPLENV